MTRLLLVATPEDKEYLPRLKPCIGTASCAVVLATPTTLAELDIVAREKHADAILSTSPALLQKLVGASSSRKKPSIDNYAGSLFTSYGKEIVFLHPLEQLVTVPYGPFLANRYASKLVDKGRWQTFAPFTWELLTPGSAEELFQLFQSACLIGVDIETFSDPLSIRCVGYTAVLADGRMHSVVIPCDSMYNLTWIRKFNWELKAPKVFQNGKYDVAYLSMYDAVPYNYLWDTATLLHSWYSELPKDLGAISAFAIRESMYWKDLAQTSDLHTYYMYNAKDTYHTVCSLLSLVKEAPQWVLNNYANEFPLNFPCHLAEMTGILRDTAALTTQCKEVEASIEEKNAELSRCLGVKYFNVNSTVQMKQLLAILGCADLTSADAKSIEKAKFRHPFNALILNKVLAIRKLRKLVSTYLTPGKEYKGRILYALNPHGTDTSRLASREHHFWCGLQIQNIPRGPTVKKTFIADPDFVMAECDLEQAESRDTAFISGDEALIEAVSGTRDFHSVNASAFFGIPYNDIYDAAMGKPKDKPLRDLAKRVNHGANYNMGEQVLVDTMGEKRIIQAAKLLKLPRLWTYRQIAAYLLKQFHRTYPTISQTYYPGVVHEVRTTKRLTSTAVHEVPYQAVATGWVRYCFSDPSKSKSALNAYVAHPPQSLNAQTLNKAFMRVFYEIAVHPNHARNFKLYAQIHDSILFAVRIGHEYLIARVKECMQVPVTIRGYDGITRSFTVPAAAKAGVHGMGSPNWGDTE